MRALLALALAWTAAAVADPAAWRVTSPAGGELWLLGSVHYLREADYPLPAIVDDLYAQAEVLVMELDLDAAAADGSAALAASALPAGATLADVVAPDVYARAAAEAASLGIDLAMLGSFEPWLVAITLLDLGMQRHGYAAERGIEQYLARKAAADGKDIVGLETLGTQIGIFDGLSAADQEALLAQTLVELEGSAAMDELVGAWRAGELEPLAATLMEEFAAFPSLYAPLVADRNRDWIAPLERLIATGARHLVVVGALHLVGDGNVVELLAARGFAVESLY